MRGLALETRRLLWLAPSRPAGTGRRGVSAGPSSSPCGTSGPKTPLAFRHFPSCRLASSTIRVRAYVGHIGRRNRAGDGELVHAQPIRGGARRPVRVGDGVLRRRPAVQVQRSSTWTNTELGPNHLERSLGAVEGGEGLVERVRQVRHFAEAAGEGRLDRGGSRRRAHRRRGQRGRTPFVTAPRRAIQRWTAYKRPRET